MSSRSELSTEKHTQSYPVCPDVSTKLSLRVTRLGLGRGWEENGLCKSCLILGEPIGVPGYRPCGGPKYASDLDGLGNMLWLLLGDICGKYCFLIFTNTKSKVQTCQCFFKHRVTLTGWMNCCNPAGSLLWLQQIVAYILQLSGGVAERSWDTAESFYIFKAGSTTHPDLIWSVQI